MKIALAQTRAVVGDVAANVRNHVRWIEAAVARGATFVAFPELSLTGYEPALAGRLAMPAHDARLHRLQQLSDAHGTTIALGMPTPTTDNPRISLVLLQPHTERRVYCKQHLHADEIPFFTAGAPVPGLVGDNPKVGLAICYELSVDAHAEATFAAGATLYLASVAKTAKGVGTANARLAAIARRYSAPALMANCIGACDNSLCAGGTAAWNRRGDLLAQLGDDQEGLLLFDAATGEATAVHG